MPLPDLTALMQGTAIPPRQSIFAQDYPLFNLLNSDAGKSMELHWHSAGIAPREQVINAMSNAGYSASDPTASAASLSFLQNLLGPRSLPPVNVTTQSPTVYTGRGIRFNPNQQFGNAPMDPYLALRHETEHAMQPKSVDLPGYMKEVGPSLGDVIHAGATWNTVDPSAQNYQVHLTPKYSPMLGTLLGQAKQYGYPGQTMDQLLSSPMGQQWLKQRLGEYPQNTIPTAEEAFSE